MKKQTSAKEWIYAGLVAATTFVLLAVGEALLTAAFPSLKQLNHRAVTGIVLFVLVLVFVVGVVIWTCITSRRD